jgi:ATP synthase protein I
LIIKTDLAKPGRKFAFKQILFSLVFVGISTLITYFVWGISSAQSSLIGGFVVIIPNVFFALKAFRYAGARSSKKVLESFYSGEKMKILLMAILLAITFKIFPIEPIAFFTNFSLVLALPLLTPFLFKL